MTPDERIEKMHSIVSARIKVLRTMWVIKDIHVFLRNGLLLEARKILAELNQLKTEIKREGE